MPAILDVAIGTVFIFLLFSLVVSALNEYLLSLTDQRAKFLRMGLLELIGKTAQQLNAPATAAAGFWSWLFNSVSSLGGLVQRAKISPPTIAGQDLLSHGLINGFSRSENGAGTPSYIPAGAFVTALLDLIAGAVPPAALSAAQASAVTNLIADITTAQAAVPPPLTLATYRLPLTTFINAYRALAPQPEAGTLFAELHNRVADDLARAALQHALLQPAVAAISTASTLIALPAHAPYAPELNALVNNAAGTFATFQQSVKDWFSFGKSFTALQTAATVTAANLIATTAQLTATRIHAGIKALPDGQLKTALLSLFESAGRDVKQFKIALEGWFNGVMDRVSGWYKRFAQKWMIALGFVLAALFNVDTIAIVRELSNNPHLARAVASQAETWVAQNQRPLTATEMRERTEKSLAALQNAKDDHARLLAASPRDEVALKAAETTLSAAQTEANTLAAYQTAAAKLSGSGLPVGWTPEQRKAIGLDSWKFTLSGFFGGLFTPWEWFERMGDFFRWLSQNCSTLFTLSAGWFLTAIAASLGAPFWFDLLGRFVNIRAAGKAPGEKDATATPTRPPPASLDTTPGTRA
jgi:hypothetical protein